MFSLLRSIQYLILDNDNIDFDNGDEVKGTASDGGAVGIVTVTSFMVSTLIHFPSRGVGGTTGLVRGVALTLTNQRWY